VGYAAGKLVAHRCEHCDELVVRVALMQKYGLADLRGKLELGGERSALRFARRVVAEIVEPALADGDEGWVDQQAAERRRRMVVELGSMVWMNAGSRGQSARAGFAQSSGLHAARNGRAGDDDARNAGARRARENEVSVAVETVVRQIGPDID
jgi:hypothetical protein